LDNKIFMLLCSITDANKPLICLWSQMFCALQFLQLLLVVIVMTMN